MKIRSLEWMEAEVNGGNLPQDFRKGSKKSQGKLLAASPSRIIKYDLCNHEGSSMYVYQIIMGK